MMQGDGACAADIIQMSRSGDSLCYSVYGKTLAFHAAWRQTCIKVAVQSIINMAVKAGTLTRMLIEWNQRLDVRVITGRSIHKEASLPDRQMEVVWPYSKNI